MKFNFDYVKNKNVILITFLVIILAGIIYGFISGYKFDIDFKGGTRIQVELNEEYSVSDINDIVSQVTGQTPEVQTTSGGNNAVSITTQIISEETADEVITALGQKYTNMGEATSKNVQASYGKDLLNSAIIAVVVSIVLLLVYIAIRFRTLGYTAAFSAVATLMCDVSFLFAVYGVFKFPINSTFVAVILTIIGYSINATIIIYDRIRENKRLVTKSNNTAEVINNSVNQTLKRTIVTSLTTLTAIGTVLIFAIINDQATLKEFAIPLSIGIIEGAFSSIFVASNLWYSLDNLVKKFKKA